jgi:hypothetical protein
MRKNLTAEMLCNILQARFFKQKIEKDERKKLVRFVDSFLEKFKDFHYLNAGEEESRAYEEGFKVGKKQGYEEAVEEYEEHEYE